MAEDNSSPAPTAPPNPDDMAAGTRQPASPGGVPVQAVATKSARLAGVLLNSFISMFTLWVGWIVMFIIWGKQGQTPGHRCMKTQVIHLDSNQPAGRGRLLARLFVRAVFAGWVDWLVIFFSKNNRTWTDMLLRTAVVQLSENPNSDSPTSRQVA